MDNAILRSSSQLQLHILPDEWQSKSPSHKQRPIQHPKPNSSCDSLLQHSFFVKQNEDIKIQVINILNNSIDIIEFCGELF